MTKPKSRPMIKDWADVPNFIIKSARLSKGRFGAVMWMALIRHIRGPANEWTVVEDGAVMQEGCKVQLYLTEDAAREAAVRYCLEHRSWWAYARHDTSPISRDG
jgi:hypothetical protein